MGKQSKITSTDSNKNRKAEKEPFVDSYFYDTRLVLVGIQVKKQQTKI